MVPPCPLVKRVARVKKSVRPDDEDKPFFVRWNVLTRVLLVEPSVKLVARVAMDYADNNDGSSCFPSIERMVRETGLSDRTVRNGWAVLRGIEMARRVSRGNSFRGASDEYQLQIPDSWLALPTYGPHGQKFTCIACGKKFTPDAHSILCDRSKDQTMPDGKPRKKAGDGVAWIVGKFVFCSYPAGSKRGNETCLREWNAGRRKSGEKSWNATEDKWTYVWEARNDPW